MTTHSPTFRLPAGLVIDPGPGLVVRRALRDTGSVLWRDLLRTSRQPDTLVFAVVMGAFFLLLFNYVFGGSIGAGAGVDYLEFLVPGILVITALQGAQQTSMSLAADLTDGASDRFRTLPMSQVAVVAGKTVADALRNVAGLVLVLLVAVVMGYRFGSWTGAIAAVALATLVGYGFSWLGAAIAAAVRKPDTVGMLSMFWLFPLMLASTVFAPAASMPGWLTPFTTYQPISAAADAVRGLAAGTPDLGSIVLTIGWTVLLLGVFVPLTARAYRKVRT